ncbi:MAG TPA: hypothetical protein VKT82_32305 [Ktedonobacterales bacterium]|nr:hypothetical protein [Ktedonobacterales bacterium]
MEGFKESAAFLFSWTFRLHQRGRRLLLIGGIALALALTLGAALVTSQAQAAGPGAAPGANVRLFPTRTPGASGQCGGQLTVSSVTERTITVTGPNGNTETIYITSHTQYVKAGQVVTASAVQVGSHIYVTGACGQGHSIKATRVEIVS